jgi:signal transduction histidine kinase
LEYVREYRVRPRDDDYAWVQERSQIVCQEDGKIDYITGILFDVSDRKKTEEDKQMLEAQLLQSQKMEAVGRLAGGVAHDFNNMLSVILGYTELVLARLKPVDPIYGNLKAVQEAANRSADLTRQLLAFSRRQIIAPRVLDLNDQMKGMERLLTRIIGEDIEVDFQLSDVLWPVYMDPAQIDQIVANLAVNSRDAMPGGGKLTVETANVVFDTNYCQKHLGFVSGSFAMLAVSDTGCGMDKKTLEHVFEPFFTTKTEGTGLGLATVYGIVKQNNGFVNVYSEPGQGTTVKVYISRYTGQEQVTSAGPEEVKAAGGSETLLLVEDETQVRQLMKTILEELGYTVLEASGPGEAIVLCERHPGEINLLLTDVVIPDLTCKELEARIKARKPGIRTLFMSGYTANAIAHRGVLDKGIQFLQKPFSMEVLAKKVREVLEN